MEINYFDLVASIIILLLGLKGILNGFFKEVY
jgi:membrane protein required for colicin V production